MIVYLVRHGESIGNAQRIHQDAFTPLSPVGETQAGKVAERLKTMSFDEIWTSPMVRAKRTAEFINMYQQVPLHEVDEIREIKRATSFEGKRYDDPSVIKVKQTISMGSDVGPKDPYLKYEDGESLAEFLERMVRAMQKLVKKAAGQPEDFTLCLTAHGFVVSTLFLLAAMDTFVTPELLHETLSRMRHANTGITVIKISRTGDTKALTFSDFSHL